MISENSLEKLEFSKILKYVSRYTSTEKGKTKVLQTLPSISGNLIKQEILFVEQAKRLLIEKEEVPIDYLADIDEPLSRSKIEGTVLESKKILEILKLLTSSRILSQYFRNNRELSPDLFALSQNLYSDKLLEHNIQSIITLTGEVKDSASKKLAEIRKEINQKKNDLVKSVNRIVKNLTDKDIIREDYLTLRDGRIVIPVKAEHKRHIRGFIHSESSTGQTVYIEPEETLDLNNEILSLSFAEKREIERILKELTNKIGEVSDLLKISLAIIADFDSIYARAKYSIEIIGNFPELNTNGMFYIQQGRHPILLQRLGREKTVAVNIKIAEKNVTIITGPNAGGKTVVLKTVGLLVIMVQSGIPIPAGADSNFNIFENILIDIGDEQSIDDDLSTFSSHLSNIKSILLQAKTNSLVLVDEIGTGTDPSEGAALATSILISLQKIGAKVLATTHHGSLKLIANALPGFENAAMEFDHKNLEPTYHFKQGIPGSSYAFEIAKRIGYDDEFLKTAKEYLDSDKHNIETFLSEIESKSFELNEKLKKLEIENARLSGLSNLYKQHLDRLNKEKKEILKKASSDASDYIKDLNKKVEYVIKELKECNASSKSIKTAKNLISELKEKNKKLYSENIELNSEKTNFKAGDYVVINDTQTSGQILEIDSERNKALLSVGSLKMLVELNSLLPGKAVKTTGIKSNNHTYSSDSISTRLDIRGDKPEEAEFKVIKFIDDAYSSSLERIEILHGKGTGALKKTVKEILKSHEKVTNYYFAPIEIGGDGITIIELSKE